MARWVELLAAAERKRQPFVVITLAGIRGSAPGQLGARAFVNKDGLIGGTVGGGKLEHRAIEHARALLQNRASFSERCESVTWNLTRDIEMTCGGEVVMLFELFSAPSMHVRLFGAGHVAQAVVRTLVPLDCLVTVIDWRTEWLEKLPTQTAIEAVPCDDLPGYVAQCAASDFFVVMTRGHASDLPILTEIFRRFPDARYVGCMGSDVKARRMRRELAEAGIPPDVLERFRCPIGLSLGSNAPEEIAISVVAQLLQSRG